MAKAELVDKLKTTIGQAVAFRDKELKTRHGWGTITFEKASNDLTRIFDVIGHLSILPVEYLTDSATNQIEASITPIIQTFQQINNFTVEIGNPTGTRDTIVNQLSSLADNLYSHAAPWVPFLAYQKGDVETNIKALTSAVKEANAVIDKAKKDIEGKQNEIGSIIVKAREASASAGAAVFTQDFLKEAEAINNTAVKWLYATIAFSLLTVIVAIVMFFLVSGDPTKYELLQRLGSKMVVIAMLITATLWCGRIYKALLHQSAQHRHRALSLQTFQAFSHAASDVQTKDAVLMEATKSIFAYHSTGYLDKESKSGDGGTKIVEIAKVLDLNKGK